MVRRWARAVVAVAAITAAASAAWAIVFGALGLLIQADSVALLWPLALSIVLWIAESGSGDDEQGRPPL